MVLERTTNFFARKTKKESFWTLFWMFCLVFSGQKTVFLSKTIFSYEKICFSAQNHLFPKKVGFPYENHLFPRKKLVFPPKTIFSLSKKTFFEIGRIVSQIGCLVFPRKTLVFLPKTIFFPRKKLVFHAKTIFFLGKLGISLQDQLFPRKDCIFHLLFVRVANYAHHYCDSIPLSISTIQ